MSNLVWHAEIDAQDMRKEIKRINQQMKGLSRDVQKQGKQMDSTFKRMGQAMAGYFSITATKGFLDQIIRVRGEFQQLDIALQTMLGNKKEADQLMDEVVQMASKTPFSLRELGQGAKRLLAFKEPTDRIGDSLRRLGDLAAGASVPVTDLIQAYGKVSAKGKMQAEELNQFAERGIPIISELAEVVGTTDEKVYKMAEQGQIGFEELRAAIKNMTDEGGQFYNLMEKQAGSLTGQISNLGDAWDRMLNEIGENNEGIIYAGIDGLKTMVDNYETIVDILGTLVATYGAYKTAIIAVHTYQKAAFAIERIQGFLRATQQLRRSTQMLALAQKAVAMTNPYAAIGIAVGALVGTLTIFRNKTEEALSVSAEFERQLKDELESIEENFQAVKDSAKGTDQRREAINKINSEYGDYLGNLLDEKSSLEDVKDAQEEVTTAIAKNMALKAKKKELEDVKANTTEAGESFSDALGGIFGDRDDFTAKQEGKALAALKNLREGADAANIGIKQIKEALQEAGIEQELSIIQYRKLFNRINSYVIATKEEEKAVKDLDQVYQSYLESLGLVEEAKNKNENKGGGGDEIPFDLETFEKTLSEQEKAYKEYNSALRSARDEDKEAVKQYYSDLLKQGENYEQYLLKQLESFRDNVQAKIAIYQAATDENIDLSGKGNLTPLTGKGAENIGEDITPDSTDLANMDAYKQRWEETGQALQNAMDLKRMDEMGDKLIDIAYQMQDIARTAGRIDGELGDAMMGVADAVGEVGNISKMSAEGDTMGVVTAGLNGALQVTGMLINSAKERQAAEEAFYQSIRQQQHDYNLALNEQLRLQTELNEGLFLTDYAGRMKDATKSYSDAMSKLIGLENELSGGKAITGQKDAVDWGNVGKGAAGGAATGAAVGSIVPVIGTAVGGIVGGVAGALGGLFGGKKKKDTYTPVLEKWPKLIDQSKKGAERFNKELAQSLINNENITDATKNNLQNMVDWADAAEAAEEQIHQVAEELVGQMGDDLKNSLVTAFEEGTSAAKAFGDSVEEILENMISDEVVNQVMGPLLNQFGQDFKEAYAGGGYESALGLIGDFTKDAAGKVNDVNKLLEEAQKAAKEEGFSIFDGSASEDPLTGAVKGVTEETASLIGGQMNAIRINQAESLRIMNESVRYQAAIASNTRYNQHLEGIHSEIKSLNSRDKASSNSDPLKAKGL